MSKNTKIVPQNDTRKAKINQERRQKTDERRQVERVLKSGAYEDFDFST